MCTAGAAIARSSSSWIEGSRDRCAPSVPVADTFERLVLFPVQEVALAATQRADLRAEEEGAADRRDHDGDQRPERHVRSLYRPRFECQTRRRAPMPELPDLVH